MSFYEKWSKALLAKDIKAQIDCYHEDFEFVRHQLGSSMNKQEMSAMITGMYETGKLKIASTRCIYENEDILVEHMIVDFPDGTTESIIAAYMLKDGKIIRQETGATLVSKDWLEGLIRGKVKW